MEPADVKQVHGVQSCNRWVKVSASVLQACDSPCRLPYCSKYFVDDAPVAVVPAEVGESIRERSPWRLYAITGSQPYQCPHEPHPRSHWAGWCWSLKLHRRRHCEAPKPAVELFLNEWSKVGREDGRSPRTISSLGRPGQQRYAPVKSASRRSSEIFSSPATRPGTISPLSFTLDNFQQLSCPKVLRIADKRLNRQLMMIVGVTQHLNTWHTEPRQQDGKK